MSNLYKWFGKPIFFLFDPEKVHNFITFQAQLLGQSRLVRNFLRKLFGQGSPLLRQKIVGIEFNSPIGLAAGFDYEARLTQILPSIGFGFQTVGTITNIPYAGNPPPRLGRLPKSKSLMVFKGFKNAGAFEISRRLKNQKLENVGISIGKSNSRKVQTQKSAVADILSAFSIFEDSNIKNTYYEINISCPNLFGNVSFYPPKNLDELLTAVDSLKLKKPLFVKMPIELSNEQTLKLLDVIIKHKIKGVIFGNLQKDRKDPALDPEETAKFKNGNFSGKPTEKRSNELITLAYKKYRDKLIIVGCGGIFSASDAYKKIKLGATLVQLITGLIYEGPLLVAQINSELPKLLEKDGYKNVSEAIGADS